MSLSAADGSFYGLLLLCHALLALTLKASRSHHGRPAHLALHSVEYVLHVLLENELVILGVGLGRNFCVDGAMELSKSAGLLKLDLADTTAICRLLSSAKSCWPFSFLVAGTNTVIVCHQVHREL